MVLKENSLNQQFVGSSVKVKGQLSLSGRNRPWRSPSKSRDSHGCAASGPGDDLRQGSGLRFSMGFALLGSCCAGFYLPVVLGEFREN